MYPILLSQNRSQRLPFLKHLQQLFIQIKFNSRRSVNDTDVFKINDNRTTAKLGIDVLVIYDKLLTTKVCLDAFQIDITLATTKVDNNASENNARLQGQSISTTSAPWCGNDVVKYYYNVVETVCNTGSCN